MNEDTQFIPRQEHAPDSRFLNVSLRGWIALIVIVTVCAMSFLGIDIKEPLYTLAGMVMGFYFAQQQKKTP